MREHSVKGFEGIRDPLVDITHWPLSVVIELLPEPSIGRRLVLHVPEGIPWRNHNGVGEGGQKDGSKQQSLVCLLVEKSPFAEFIDSSIRYGGNSRDADGSSQVHAPWVLLTAATWYI